MSTATPGDRTSTSTATGSRRCSRCSTSTAPYAGCAAAGSRPGSRGTTTRSATAGWPRPGEREQQAMLDYIATDRCRMRFLRDAARRPGGRRLRALRQLRWARRCRPRSPRRRSRRPTPGCRDPAWSSSPARCGRPRWPTSASTSRARSPRRALEGRAVARLTDLGYGQALRELFAPGAPDGPVPVPLVRAVVEVLGDWQPPVDGIVVVESATRPLLTADLADGLSRYLRVPILGRFAIVDPDVRPARARPTPPSGSPLSGGATPCRPRCSRRQPGAARRRPGGHRLDPHPGRPCDPGGRRDRGVLPLTLAVQS